MRKVSLVLLALTMGCAAAEEERGVEPASSVDSKLSVHVVNYPLQYFAERIGGGFVEVRFPAPAEGDPAYWSPGAETVAAYQRADVILLNGANYAKWVARVALPASKLVDTSTSFHDRLITIENAVVHSHGPEGEHSHGEKAFTTWLDPTLAVEQARAIRDAFIAARPENEGSFQREFSSLEEDLMELDEQMKRAVSGKNERPLVGSHPVYQYLARRYDLNLEAVHFEPGIFPDADAWRELENLLEEHPGRWILWEGSPIPETARKLEELGLTSVVFDPSGNRPAEGDFLSVMRSNVSALERVFAND